VRSDLGRVRHLCKEKGLEHTKISTKIRKKDPDAITARRRPMSMRPTATSAGCPALLHDAVRRDGYCRWLSAKTASLPSTTEAGMG